MQIQLIQSKANAYKIIQRGFKSNPALLHIAELLKNTNRHSEIHVGIYQVGNAEFRSGIMVKSLTSGKQEFMTKKNWNKFLRGERQIYVYKPVLKVVKTKEEWDKKEEEFLKI